MGNSKPSILHRRPSLRGAFTLVECLISLAITAILLAAVATAFKASVVNYGENEEMFWTINNARQALARMTTQLRTGYNVDPTPDSNECSFFTADDEDLTYDFEAADRKLYLVKNGAASGTRYALCDNVVAANFIKTPTNDGLDCKSVQISLTVRSGDSRRTLSSAAVIRRNLGQ